MGILVGDGVLLNKGRGFGLLWFAHLGVRILGLKFSMPSPPPCASWLRFSETPSLVYSLGPNAFRGSSKNNTSYGKEGKMNEGGECDGAGV